MLCVYTDEFEIVHPIGTHRKKHKLTAFYWTLLNIPTEFRSKPSGMKLLALAKRRFGTTSINTVGFCGHSSVAVWHWVVYRMCWYECCLADTPAAQLIGSFTEGFACAMSPCWSYDAKHDHLAQIFTAAKRPTRDTNEHTESFTFLVTVMTRIWVLVETLQCEDLLFYQILVLMLQSVYCMTQCISSFLVLPAFSWKQC